MTMASMLVLAAVVIAVAVAVQPDKHEDTEDLGGCQRGSGALVYNYRAAQGHCLRKAERRRKVLGTDQY